MVTVMPKQHGAVLTIEDAQLATRACADAAFVAKAAGNFQTARKFERLAVRIDNAIGSALKAANDGPPAIPCAPNHSPNPDI